MRRRRQIEVFGLSFLDAITCGFGAVVLFYMVINAAVGMRAGRMTGELRAEADRLEVEVLAAYQDLVDLRNRTRRLDDDSAVAFGLARRLIEQVEAIRHELATYDETTLAREQQLNKLKADLRALEQEARRLSAAAPSDETPGDELRAFIGDGERQYLTGLKVGGQRIVILVDASASMLDETIVNVIRRRNLPDETKIRADKWQRAVRSVDWLTTQIPADSQFQLYTFNSRLTAVLPDSAGRWLDGGSRDDLDRAVAALRGVVPRDGTNLEAGLAVLDQLRPAPDNLILLVDGLPTLGRGSSERGMVSGKQRMRLFERAVAKLSPRLPVNVILLPMDGDPMAASAFWRLAVTSGGSLINPAEDWP
ncbi:MAG TPA: hypothetical protein VD788_12670 [Candidatus Polarisedimenticolaceae bacterium]|nr:hypothetical protein [Candidatus Polarisedimenticolaceae bacterium]